MALARVVTFEDVNPERLEEMRQELEGSEPPEDIPASEMIVLHDPDSASSLVVVFFENEDDYRRGDEALNAMPADETHGRRTSVKRYDVSFRVTG